MQGDKVEQVMNKHARSQEINFDYSILVARDIYFKHSPKIYFLILSISFWITALVKQ